MLSHSDCDIEMCRRRYIDVDSLSQKKTYLYSFSKIKWKNSYEQKTMWSQ